MILYKLEPWKIQAKIVLITIKTPIITTVMIANNDSIILNLYFYIKITEYKYLFIYYIYIY